MLPLYPMLPVLLWMLVFCLIYHWLAPRMAVTAIQGPLVKRQIHNRRALVVLPALTAVPASPVLLALSVLPVLLWVLSNPKQSALPVPFLQKDGRSCLGTVYTVRGAVQRQLPRVTLGIYYGPERQHNRRAG